MSSDAEKDAWIAAGLRADGGRARWPRYRVRLAAVGGRTRHPAPVAGAPGGKLTIGIAFDQPGLGLKTGDAYTGFDVDTATYVAEALGVTRGQHHLEGGQPERPAADSC